jgi:hypothetical protein
MKPVLPILVAGLIAPLHGTITATFNADFSPPDGGVSSNLADSSGTVTNGLVYGILLDLNGNGFLNQYDPGFSLNQGALVNMTTGGGGATDDQLFISLGVNGTDTNQFLTSDTSLLLEGDFSTPGGNGGVRGLGDIPGSVQGKQFALIWFDFSQARLSTTVDPGDLFGLLTDASFVLPSDGGTSTYDAPFKGVDPVRPANDGIFLVPEPNAALLCLIGTLGLARRRRR